jgi:hypothetical protein
VFEILQFVLREIGFSTAETMKNGGSLPGLRGKQVSIALIALVCTTFIVWGLERAPFLNVFPVDERVRRLIHPDYLQENRLETLSSGSSSGTPPVMESLPSLPTGEPDSISAKELLPISGIPSNVTKYFSVENSPSTSGKRLIDEKLPFSPAEELPTENSPSSSDKDILVGGLFSPEADNMKSSLAEKEKSSAIEKSSDITAEELPPTKVEKSSAIEKKVCDYTEGKWVQDSRKPIYSGKMCKRWLSGMWACRLTQRPDFSYEKYRWQPDNCDMPDFKGRHFLARMQHKTIAFVGDSLGRQQFQSIMCLITGGKDSTDVQDVGKEYGLVRARGAIRPDGWAYRFRKTNTTVLYYWSASLCEIEPLNPGNPSTNFAMHLDRPAWFLRTNLYRFDVVVLNTGHHWNRGKLNANRWHMYVNGQPKNDRTLRDLKSARNLTVHSVVKWLDEQFDKYPNLRVFMRTLSPRHFFNGDWNSGGRCDNTKLLFGSHNVSHNNDPAAESAVQGTRVEYLDITGISELRDDAHLSKYSLKSNNGSQDCLHWCLPGVPDTWNELLFARLLFPQPKKPSAQI